MNCLLKQFGVRKVGHLRQWLGYVSCLGTIGQSAATAKNMCWLVGGLYMFSAIVQFIGLALVYNLDKKTLTQMNEELAAR